MKQLVLWLVLYKYWMGTFTFSMFIIISIIYCVFSLIAVDINEQTLVSINIMVK